jgi:hypothetical protein
MEQPSKVLVLAILIIISGLINILGGGVLALLIIIGTVGLGLFCAPILVLPIILGVAELVHGINLLSDPPRVKEPSVAIAILEICCILFANLFAVVVGVVNLVLSSDQEVKDYFASYEN